MENKVTLEITPLSPLEVIIDFNDPIIRKALIDFGWTPPKEKCLDCDKNCTYAGSNESQECPSEEVGIKDPKMIECEDCGGYGETMKMVCYGGSPIEQTDTCETCNGEGEVEV